MDHARAVRDAVWLLRKCRTYKELLAAKAKVSTEVANDSQYKEACLRRHMEIVKDNRKNIKQ